MKKRFALLLVLVLCCLALPALADNVCKFDKTVTTLFEGDTLQTVLLLEGDPAEGTVTYSSNAEKRAVVDDHGVVSGIAKGNVTITATVKTEKKTYKATIALKVLRKVEEITVDERGLNLFSSLDPLISPLLITDADDAASAIIQPAQPEEEQAMMTSFS